MSLKELLEKGESYYNSKKFAEAEEYFRKAIEIEPDNFKALLHLCSISIEQGDFKNSLDILLTKDLKAGLGKAYWKWLGQSYQGLANYPEAIKAYKKALEIDPKYDKALISLILLYQQQGDLEQAITYTRQGTINFPNNNYYWQLLDQFHSEREDYANACSHLFKVIRMYGMKKEYQSILSSYQKKYPKKGGIIAPIEISINGKEGNINIKNKEFQSISSIKDLDSTRFLLTKLRICNTQLTKIDNLESLIELVYLYLSENNISKIEGLDDLSNLQYLFLSENNISQIEGLENLTNLIHLFLGNNKIKEINGLDKLKKLRLLNLGKNEITKIQGLKNLRELNVLHLNDNQIEKIEGLDYLTKLDQLNLNYNRIGEITGIENLSNLKFLHLNGNQLTSMKGLEKASNLEFLHLQNNNLEVVSNLANMPKLNDLQLMGNNKLPKIFLKKFKDFGRVRQGLAHYCDMSKDEVEKIIEKSTQEQHKKYLEHEKERILKMEFEAIPPPIRTKFQQLLTKNKQDQCLYCGKKLPNNKNLEEYLFKKINSIITEANKKLPEELRSKIKVDMETQDHTSNWQMEGPMGQQRWVNKGPGTSLQITDIKRIRRYTSIFYYSEFTKLKGLICEQCANEFINRVANVFSKVKSTKSPKLHAKMHAEIKTNYYKEFEFMVDKALANL